MNYFKNLVLASVLTAPVVAKADLYFMSEVGGVKRIVRAHDDGSNQAFVTPAGVWSLYPDVSADGKLFAVAQGESETKLKIVLEDAKTGQRKIFDSGLEGMHLHPDLSGDGRYLAFSGPDAVSGKQQIFIVDLSSKEQRPTRLEVDADCYFPTLSSDGNTLVYQRNITTRQREIVEVDLFSRHSKIISSSEVSLNMAPALSFDDRYVAYTSQRDGNWDVYIYDRLTSVTKRATSNTAMDFAPNFSADGSLVFASNRKENFGLYKIPAALVGSENAQETLVTETAGGDLYAPVYTGSRNYQQTLHTPILAPARSSFGVTTVNDRVYIVGGHQGKEHTYPESSFLGSVEYYDLKTKAWKKAAPRNKPSHGFEVVTYGKYIYAFGGFAYSPDHKPRWRSLDEIERYDTEQDKWEIIGHMPRKRSSYVIGEANGKAYLIGGWDSTPKHENDLEGVFHRKIDVFDFATETMTELDVDLPNPLRRAFTAVSRDNKIFLIGGLGQGASHFELLDRVTEFNPADKSWKEHPTLPFATFAPAAAFMGDDLYVFGGMFKTAPKDYVYVNHVYRLPAGQQSWQNTGRYLHEPKGFARVVNTSDNEVLILGGHQYFQDGSDAPVPTVESFQVK